MARISTYNTGVLTTDDYLLGTDDPAGLAPTKNFTVQALIDLTNVAAGNTNNFLDAVTLENGITLPASDSDKATVTFSRSSGLSDITFDFGTAAFKATSEFATSADLTAHLNDTTQPHSLDSIVADNSIGAAKLNIDGSGTAGQRLISDGDGTFSWETVTDNNDNYYLSGVTHATGTTTFALAGGGPSVTTTIFKEGAFLSKADIRADVIANTSFTISDFSDLGTLAGLNTVTATELSSGAVTNLKIAENTIEESRLNISNSPVSGYVLTSDGGTGFTWALNSASNYYLSSISKSGNILTFNIAGGYSGAAVTYGFGGAAFLNVGTGGSQVAAGDHTHTLSDITDSGALASLSSVDTGEIATGAVTLPKLSATGGTAGQVLAINSGGTAIEWINSSGTAIPSLRLLPSSIGTAGQILRVNSGATAVEYVGLTVAPGELASGSQANQILGTDSNGDLEWRNEGVVSIADGSVTTAKLANDAVTPAKTSIVDDNIVFTSGHILVADGTEFDSVALSGDATITSAGVISLANDITIGGVFTANGGNVDLASETYATSTQPTRTINVGSPTNTSPSPGDTTQRNVNIGVTTGTSGTTIKAGTGNIDMDTTGSVTIDSSVASGSAIQISATQNGNVTLQSQGSGQATLKSDSGNVLVQAGGEVKLIAADISNTATDAAPLVLAAGTDRAVRSLAMTGDIGVTGGVLSSGTNFISSKSTIASTTPADADEILIGDTSATAVNKIAYSAFRDDIIGASRAITAHGSGTAFTIAFNSNLVHTATASAAATFTFTNPKIGITLDLIVNGNFAITFAGTNATFNKVGSGNYDGSSNNLIQIVCTDDGANPIYHYSVAAYASDTTP